MASRLISTSNNCIGGNDDDGPAYRSRTSASSFLVTYCSLISGVVYVIAFVQSMARHSSSHESSTQSILDNQSVSDDEGSNLTRSALIVLDYFCP